MDELASDSKDSEDRSAANALTTATGGGTEEPMSNDTDAT
jgi:hypothetical protein